MHRFNGYNIELTRGDSLTFRVSLTGRTLPEGSVALFTVKTHPREETPVIQKRLDASLGQLTVTLTPRDTDLPSRTYFWDVRVLIPLSGGGWELVTPMEYAAFTILEAIGRGFGVAGDPGFDGDAPVLSVLINEARDVIAQAQDAAARAEAAVGAAPSVTLSKEGGVTTVTATDKNGTTVTEIHDGAPGPQGPQGETGPAGTISKVTATITNTGGKPGVNVGYGGTASELELYLDFMNLQGPQGLPGQDGYTPSRGTDYWTAEDEAWMKGEIQTYVNNYLINGAW